MKPAKLKAVIFGLTNLVFEELHDEGGGVRGRIDNDKLNELTRFVDFMKIRGIRPIVLTNRAWKLDGKTDKEVLSNSWGEVPWYCATRDGLTKKPAAGAINHVLSDQQLEPNEVLFLGNTRSDMIAAVNSRVLFLNGIWYSDSVNYGFKFESPKEVAKFIDIFCLRDHWFNYRIEEGALRYYALNTFSTFKDKYKKYSEAAKKAAKFGIGDVEFWLQYICASLYFSGMYEEINYIAPYPGHNAGSGNAKIADVMGLFGKCFRAPYLSDLIVRHTTAPKSQYNPKTADHWRQLSTIRLSPAPTKPTGDSYKNPPLKAERTVLVMDDFCTRGYSLEAARLFLESAGVNVIMVSWLKTINTDYKQIVEARSVRPYESLKKKPKFKIKSRAYGSYVVNYAAHEELEKKLDQYVNWNW